MTGRFFKFLLLFLYMWVKVCTLFKEKYVLPKIYSIFLVSLKNFWPWFHEQVVWKSPALRSLDVSQSSVQKQQRPFRLWFMKTYEPSAVPRLYYCLDEELNSTTQLWTTIKIVSFTNLTHCWEQITWYILVLSNHRSVSFQKTILPKMLTKMDSLAAHIFGQNRED